MAWPLKAHGDSSSGSSPPRPRSPSPPVRFPLHVKAGHRYLVDASDQPFLVHGDTAWSIVAQLKDAEITAYLDKRAEQGFNTILFSAPEAFYTSQNPFFLNVDGLPPFSRMADFSQPVEAYWSRVDKLVNGAKARGMACLFNPAYLGYPGGTDGWAAAVQAMSPAALRAYGVFLAHRYTQGNVIWCLGGDRNGDDALIERQWNIVLGIKSVRTSDIVMAHPLADATHADDAWTYWNRFRDFTLNAIYGYEPNGFYVDRLAAQAYGRPGPFPFLAFEFKYENSAGATLAMLRRQSYGALLYGACGQIFGNNPVWHFDSPQWRSEPYRGTWRTNLDSPGAVQQGHVKALFGAYAWWKLAPATDTSLVSSALRSGARRLYPALAADHSFAFIYVPADEVVTVQLAALAPPSVRVRLYDPERGTFAPVSGSPLPNTGRVKVATGGERVIVLDAAG